MDDRSLRGFVSLALAALLLVVGALAGQVFPVETKYTWSLFLFGSAIFFADAAVTFTRTRGPEADADRERDAAASPWRIAFAVAFVLALISAARTGSSFVTLTSMILAAVAAGVYLVRRRFFAYLRIAAQQPRSGGSEIRRALAAKDHAALARLLEEKLDAESDASRRNTLLLSLGAVHIVRGEYDDAVRAFERVNRRVREGSLDMEMVADLNLASAYVAKGDFESAESCLSRIDEKTLPEEFRAAWDMNRSSVLVGKGAHEEAIRFLDGLPIESMHPRTQFPFLRDLAEALAASGADPARALDVATRCLTIESGPQALNVMGCVLIAQKKFEEAAGRLSEALRLNPEGRENLRVFAETLYYLGIAQRGTGDAASAKECFTRAGAVKGGGRFSTAAQREIEAA